MLDIDRHTAQARDAACHQYSQRWVEIRDSYPAIPADLPMTKEQILDLLFDAGVDEHMQGEHYA